MKDANIKNIPLSQYDREVLLDILEDHISEYGSKDWELSTKLSLHYIIEVLGASEEQQKYLGGILGL